MVDRDDPVRRAAESLKYISEAMGYTEQGFPEGRGLEFIEDLDIERLTSELGEGNILPEPEIEQAVVEFIENMAGVTDVEGLGMLSGSDGLETIVFNRWTAGTKKAGDAFDQSTTHHAALWRVMRKHGIHAGLHFFRMDQGEDIDEIRTRFNRDNWYEPGVRPLGLIRFPLLVT